MKILTKGTYYGVQELEKSFKGVLLSQYNYTGCAGGRTDWHYHENPYFWFILNGDMIDGNKKTKTLCPAGSLMFTNWQEVHYGSKHSKNASGFHLEFQKDWFADNGIDLALLEGSKLIQNPQAHFLFAKLYYELIHSDQYSEVTVEMLLVQICDVLNGLVETDIKNIPNWVNDLKELLHFDTSNLSLKYLSDQLGVHAVHISRAAPKYLSKSLGEYIRQQKLKKAIPLLFDPNNSLTQIAYQTGFADQSHFTRVFNAYFNMNPSLYQKKVTKK